MRYLFALIISFSCTQQDQSKYTPNPEAVGLNNRASELMWNLSAFDTTGYSAVYLQSLELINKGLQIDKTYSVLYDNKQKVLIKLGRYNDAISNLKMATENIEHFAEGFMGLGFLHDFMNNENEATSNYKKAIQQFELRNENCSMKQRIHNDCEIAFVTLLLNEPNEAHRLIDELYKQESGNDEVNFYRTLIKEFNKEKFLADRFGERL
ncbi:hypothetical protein [Reichenbachiella sp.]